MKRVSHAVRNRRAELAQANAAGGSTSGWLMSLRAYEARLGWHCHFLQNIEDESALEFENMSRAYDGIREEYFNQSYFAAWCAGRTGYPLVDACMRHYTNTAGSTSVCELCWSRSRRIIYGVIGAQQRCFWENISSTLNPVSITHKCKCSLEPRESTRYVFIHPSSK